MLKAERLDVHASSRVEYGWNSTLQEESDQGQTKSTTWQPATITPGFLSPVPPQNTHEILSLNIAPSLNMPSPTAPSMASIKSAFQGTLGE